MESNRSFSSDDIPTKKDDYHGMCDYVRTQPDIASKNGVESVNIEMTFEEAVQLSLSIQSCVMQLNRYKRSTVEGREMGMVLSVKTGTTSITVIEKRIKPLE